MLLKLECFVPRYKFFNIVNIKLYVIKTRLLMYILINAHSVNIKLYVIKTVYKFIEPTKDIEVNIKLSVTKTSLQKL